MTSRRLILKASISMLLATIVGPMVISSATAKSQLSLYTYSDTRRLVALVEDAAALVERDGEAAFKQFAQQDSKWLNEDYYLFVYALDGTCMFHPVTPDLIGKNVMAL